MRRSALLLPLSLLMVMMLTLSACSSTETTTSSSESSQEEAGTQTTTEESTKSTAEESSSSTEESQSATVNGGTEAESTEAQEAEETNDISKWTMVTEILSGFREEPNEQFFTPHLDFLELTSKGGELHFSMKPSVDLNCSQRFIVGWEFDTDIQTVYEGQVIKVNVYNRQSLEECYKQAKTSMAYGGELVIDLKPPGSSHFLSEEAYKRFHEGYSQYLFALTKQTGLVGPPGSLEPSAGASGEILVKNGVYNVGDFDCPYGNFSFSISAGGVFTYTVTYRYQAVGN